MAYIKKLELTSDEVETIVDLLDFAISDIGHPLLEKSPHEKALIEYYQELKEKVEKI